MQKQFQLPKYATDALGGVSGYEWRGRTGLPPLAADVDYFLVAFEPVADGAFTDQAATLLLLGKPDVPRNATVTVVDADASIGVWVRLTGLDQFDNTQTEVLRVSAGESSITGQAIWERITKVETKTVGVVTAGSDTISIGIGDAFGLPKPFGSMVFDTTDDYWYGDVTRAVSDWQAGARADALDSSTTEFSKEFASVTFIDDVADGTSRYWVQMIATKPQEGVLPVRPRGYNIVTQN